MVKYYCDRCKKEDEQCSLFNLVIYISDNKIKSALCDNCLREFKRLLEIF